MGRADLLASGGESLPRLFQLPEAPPPPRRVAAAWVCTASGRPRRAHAASVLRLPFFQAPVTAWAHLDTQGNHYLNVNRLATFSQLEHVEKFVTTPRQSSLLSFRTCFYYPSVGPSCVTSSRKPALVPPLVSTAVCVSPSQPLPPCVGHLVTCLSPPFDCEALGDVSCPCCVLASAPQ